MRRHGRALGEGLGFRLADACIPIVTGACLFDVLVGKNAHPDKAMGAKAAQLSALESFAAAKDGTAGFGSSLEQGNVGRGVLARPWGRWAGPSRL